jgi:hypothetical protein
MLSTSTATRSLSLRQRGAVTRTPSRTLARAYAAIAVLTGVTSAAAMAPDPRRWAGVDVGAPSPHRRWFDNDRGGLAVGYRGDIHGVEATRRFEGVMYVAVA